MSNGTQSATVLSGDLGGTKTLLRLSRSSAQQQHQVLYEKRYTSAEFTGLTAMVHQFLSGAPQYAPQVACFGVAGPIRNHSGGQSARLTNLPWELDSTTLAAQLELTQVRLINDFQAVGYGIEVLGPEDLSVLQHGEVRPGAPRLVVGAGTGLGVAQLCPMEGAYDTFPTEGGHMDFAPTNALQDGLLAYLRERIGGRVSYERVVCGAGLASIYRYLLSREGGEAEDDPLLAQTDPPAAISAQALGTEHPLANRALDLFIDVYGSFTGNLALAGLSYGGIYVAGGIAPKILARLQQGRFIDAFNNKGRMRPLTSAMSVKVVTNPQVGLLGAMVAASRLSAQTGD